MLAGVIKNSDNSYELLKAVGDKLEAVHVSSYGFSKSDSKYINNILNKLYFNSNCVYLTEEDGYKVYYDRETGFKHFMKNKEEDFEMFIKANSKDAVMYLSDDDDKSKKVKRRTRILEISALSIVILFGAYTLPILRNIAGVSEDLLVWKIYSADERNDMYDAGAVDYERALELIAESDLEPVDKEILGNEELLKLVFKYYKDTPMEYTANMKLNGLRVEEYTADDGELEAKTFGYYSILTPNVLNIRTDSDTSTLIHEFIHLLQADGCYYHYLDEAVASLMTSEYFYVDSVSYEDAVDNLKLLINIVGPEPIFKLVFGGDDSDLLKIFRDNLLPSEASDLVEKLQEHPESDMDSLQYQSVRESLFKLYKNMYGNDISEDLELSLLFLSDSRTLNNSCNICYLNVGRILEEGNGYLFLVNSNTDKQKLVDEGYITIKDCEYFKKDISYEDYVNLGSKDRSKVIFNDDFSSDTLPGCINNNNNTSSFYLLDDSVEKDEYITKEGCDVVSIRNLPGREISLVTAFKDGYVDASLVKERSEISNLAGWDYYYTTFGKCTSLNPDIICNGSDVLYCTRSMMSKFPEQYSRICDGVIDSYKINTGINK